MTLQLRAAAPRMLVTRVTLEAIAASSAVHHHGASRYQVAPDTQGDLFPTRE
jgi:hypothetical protein